MIHDGWFVIFDINGIRQLQVKPKLAGCHLNWTQTCPRSSWNINSQTAMGWIHTGRSIINTITRHILPVIVTRNVRMVVFPKIHTSQFNFIPVGWNFKIRLCWRSAIIFSWKINCSFCTPDRTRKKRKNRRTIYWTYGFRPHTIVLDSGVHLRTLVGRYLACKFPLVFVGLWICAVPSWSWYNGTLVQMSIVQLNGT